MKKKILLAANDIEVITNIQNSLNKEDILPSIIISNNANIAIDLSWKENPELILIHSSIGEVSPLDMIGILKKNEPTQHIPIIFLSDKKIHEFEEEVTAFRLGTDDYIRTPLVDDVFRVRAMRVLNKSVKPHHIENGMEIDDIRISGNIKLNLTTHTAFVDDQELNLTPKEFALLYLFIKKKNRVLQRVFLSETIWEQEYSSTSQTIERHVANLRKKLAHEGQRIETIPTIGYKFVE